MILNIRTVMVANGVSQAVSGSVFEFLTEPSNVEIGIAADATGVLATINLGPDTVLEEGPVSVKTINILPVYPDDFFQDQGLPNDRIAVKLRDTTGAIRTVMTQLRITPLV